MKIKKIETILKSLDSTKRVDVDATKLSETVKAAKSLVGKEKLTGSLDGLAAQGKAKITSKLTPNVADKIEKFAE